MEMAVWKWSARRNSPSRMPRSRRLRDCPAARLEVFAHQALRESAAGAHELLKQRRMAVPRAHEIEVQTDVAQQDLARRPWLAEHLQRLAVELFEVVFEHGLVKLFLALEVIIEQRLVDAGLGGDEIGAGPGQASPGEHAFGGGQNRGPRPGSRGAPLAAGVGGRCVCA